MVDVEMVEYAGRVRVRTPWARRWAVWVAGAGWGAVGVAVWGAGASRGWWWVLGWLGLAGGCLVVAMGLWLEHLTTGFPERVERGRRRKLLVSLVAVMSLAGGIGGSVFLSGGLMEGYVVTISNRSGEVLWYSQVSENQRRVCVIGLQPGQRSENHMRRGWTFGEKFTVAEESGDGARVSVRTWPVGGTEVVWTGKKWVVGGGE